MKQLLTLRKSKQQQKTLTKKSRTWQTCIRWKVDKIKEMIGDAEKEQIGKDLAVQKAVDFVVKNAVEVEPAEEDKEEE